MNIGELIRQRGLLTEDQVAMARTQATEGRVDRAAVELGLLTEEAMLTALADEFGYEVRSLTDATFDNELLGRFPPALIFRHNVLPVSDVGGRLTVAIDDPFDLEALDELRSHCGLPVDPVLARHSEIEEAIKRHLGVGGDTLSELVANAGDDLEELDESADLSELAQTASVIRLVNELLLEALHLKASDVHIEPTQTGLIIRFRVDGLLRVQPVPPEIKRFYQAIVTRLKIMARLNIAEKRLPQDGRIEHRVGGREIDIRMSIIPMLHGEGVVLRLLDKERMAFSLGSIGLPGPMQKTFEELITLPHGIFLVTGPTGSGKTTTLYCALSSICSPETKIITVEDPVEYHLDGISQIQIHSKIGLTFAASLRSILRHDPDVILVGEIRDYETAESAIQASLTGHFVFSTLHTNDAPGAFTRLIDMGVEPYLAASTVEGVMAQRLLRRLCAKCKQPVDPRTLELPHDFPTPLPEIVYKPVGCRECKEIGYSGREGIFELMRADDGVRQMVAEGANTAALRRYALHHGMVTLRMSGWQKVLEGVTSIEEVVRVTKGDVPGSMDAANLA